MKKILASIALLFPLLTQADYAYDLSHDAADSASVHTLYGAHVDANGCNTALSVSGGAIHFGVDWKALPNFASRAGFVLPLDLGAGKAVDLSCVTSVSFSYRTSDLRSSMWFSMNSPLWTSAQAADGARGDGVVRTYVGSASTTWKTLTLDPNVDLVWLLWMTKNHASDTTQSWSAVASKVTSFQFDLVPDYNDSGDSIKTASSWIEVKGISLVDGGFSPVNGACSIVEPGPASVDVRNSQRSELRASWSEGLVLDYALTEGGMADLEVLDIAGRRAASLRVPAVASGLRVPLSLPEGAYWVRIAGASSLRTARFVVAR